MNIEYTGEHLFFGKLGNFLIVIAFTAALLSAVSYFLSFKKPAEEKAWKKVARSAFFLHAFSVAGIFAVMYYLIYNHYFEYYYVWEHSSTILPAKYIFACFWEGQEGSFLLWSFWHVVLSCFIIRSSGSWEAPVMSVISMVQVFLASMLLGIYFFSYKVGSNPFVLLREHPDMANFPFTKMPDYLSRLNDGRGLNPLLQNYWMVIHPPTLFLGFASTVIPFAYAMAALMTGKVREWVKPALPYTFFGVMILGTGILMGAAWAYEALSFGGFWAWDPVENASLVPWLTLVGGAHVMIINHKNGQSLRSCFVLIIVSFILVLYSTFLTRSGILGDTSVHAFTDLGMSGQLLLYMIFFMGLAIYLMVRHRKLLAPSKDDDSITSREFWIFIGMLVLVISCIQITFTTSIPVINKIFGTNMAPPAKPIEHYNSWQIPIAAIICLLIAIGQYFKFRQTDPKYFFRRIAFSFMLSVVLSVCLFFVFDFARYQYVALMFASIFGIVANSGYLLHILKGNLAHSGASIAHIGICLILLGALISNTKSEVISRNRLNVNLGKDFPNNENIMLMKGDTLGMGEYYVTYKGKEKKGVNVFYEIEYLKANHQTGQFEKAFSLKPVVQINERMGNVSEPDTKRFLDKDLYTHITYAELEDLKQSGKAAGEEDEYTEPKTKTIAVGDTFSTSNTLVVLTGLNKDVDRKSFSLDDNDLAVGAQLKVIDINKKTHDAVPVFIIKGSQVFTKGAEIPELGLRFAFQKINPENGKIEISVSEKKSNIREFVIMKAIIFPQINILWMGCIFMIVGTATAIIKRLKERNVRQVQ
jgi:cytochrome c-type biogenesis protein CcmF